MVDKTHYLSRRGTNSRATDMLGVHGGQNITGDGKWRYPNLRLVAASTATFDSEEIREAAVSCASP